MYQKHQIVHLKYIQFLHVRDVSLKLCRKKEPRGLWLSWEQQAGMQSLYPCKWEKQERGPSRLSVLPSRQMWFQRLTEGLDRHTFQRVIEGGAWVPAADPKGVETKNLNGSPNWELNGAHSSAGCRVPRPLKRWGAEMEERPSPSSLASCNHHYSLPPGGPATKTHQQYLMKKTMESWGRLLN